jgi:hypothetical protein
MSEHYDRIAAKCKEAKKQREAARLQESVDKLTLLVEKLIKTMNTTEI